MKSPKFSLIAIMTLLGHGLTDPVPDLHPVPSWRGSPALAWLPLCRQWDRAHWHWAPLGLVAVTEPVNFLSWLGLRPATSAGGVWHSRLALAAMPCLLRALCRRELKQVLASEASAQPRALGSPSLTKHMALLFCFVYKREKQGSKSLPCKVSKYFLNYWNLSPGHQRLS